MKMREILPNGVYIVYQDGSFELFSEELEKIEDAMQVGISWDGHKWILGKDYGDLQWTKASLNELMREKYGVIKESDAVLDWDVEEADKHLRKFFKHIPFGNDEMMPVCPMVLIQEKLAQDGILNKALRFCGLDEYEIKITRWLAERFYSNHVRNFYGYSGTLLSNRASKARHRVQGVKVWK